MAPTEQRTVHTTSTRTRGARPPSGSFGPEIPGSAHADRRTSRLALHMKPHHSLHSFSCLCLSVRPHESVLVRMCVMRGVHTAKRLVGSGEPSKKRLIPARSIYSRSSEKGDKHNRHQRVQVSGLEGAEEKPDERDTDRKMCNAIVCAVFILRFGPNFRANKPQPIFPKKFKL